MRESGSSPKCPKCGELDTPRLIVRGAGGRDHDAAGVMLRCRSCHHEWSQETPSHRRAS